MKVPTSRPSCVAFYWIISILEEHISTSAALCGTVTNTNWLPAMRTACLWNSAGGPPGEIAFSSYFKQPCPLGKTFSNEGGYMIKIVLTVAVLGSVGSFASLAMAQGKQGEASGSEVSSQCAHRRVMRPDPHDDCVRKPRSDAQLSYGQGSASQQLDQRDEGQPDVRREQPK